MTKRALLIIILIFLLFGCETKSNNDRSWEFVDTNLPSSECPKLINDNLLLNIESAENSFAHSYSDAILKYLNDGGSVKTLRQQLQNTMTWFDVEQADVTNDSFREIIVRANWTYIVGCNNNNYQSLLIIEPFDRVYGYSPSVLTNEDLNNNGIPEIIISKQSGGPYPQEYIEILEWDGHSFISLLPKDNFCIIPVGTCIRDGEIQIEQGNIEFNPLENGTKEIIITDGLDIYPDPSLPDKTIPINLILRWDGALFTIYTINLLPKR